MILITGATGNIGQELCRLLAEERIPTRVMCQNKHELAQFKEIGFEAVVGNFNDLVSLRQAMQGCDRMFLVTPAIPDQTALIKKAIDAATESNLKQILKISAGDANLNSAIAWAKDHAEGDHYLRSGSIAWTVLRPTGFMMNLLDLHVTISKGFISNPTENGKVSWIDHRDIALVAKHVLTDDIQKHQRATYFLTGPEALSTDDIAMQLTDVLRYQVKSIPVSLEEMRKNFQQAGVDEWRIQSFLAQFEMVKGAHAVDVTEDVQRITGQKARSFKQFATEFKRVFQGIK